MPFDFIDGQPGAKARRVRTLSNLIGSEEGISLARAWGERFNVDAALRRSMDEDILSILEYAVRHDGGGFYYPNAVMPFRGLLENEAYAHSLISDVLSEYASSHSDEAATWYLDTRFTEVGDPRQLVNWNQRRLTWCGQTDETS